MAVLLLTGLSILVRASLLKWNETILQKNNQPIVENIPLQQVDDNSSVMEVLQGDDELAIRNLILNSKDDELMKNLRFLNLDSTGMHALEMRRRTNHVFINNLIKVQHDVPTALVWLKNNIEFDVCQTMLSDWKYTGEILSYHLHIRVS